MKSAHSAVTEDTIHRRRSCRHAQKSGQKTVIVLEYRLSIDEGAASSRADCHHDGCRDVEQLLRVIKKTSLHSLSSYDWRQTEDDDKYKSSEAVTPFVRRQNHGLSSSINDQSQEQQRTKASDQLSTSWQNMWTDCGDSNATRVAATYKQTDRNR